MRIAILAIFLIGCVDSTGSALVTFHAVAAGPSDASGGRLERDTVSGYHLTLTTAKVHVGAIYLRTSALASGAATQSCIALSSSNNNYSGQVRLAFEPGDVRYVDLLSSVAQPFSTDGNGTTDPSPIGEVWLVNDQVEAVTDTTIIAVLGGTATKDGVSYPFSANISISTGNRGIASDPATPGANPICKQRIVTQIPTHFSLSQGGTLLLRVDPAQWLTAIEFSDLMADPNRAGSFIFPDDKPDQQSGNLFSAVHAFASYQLTFTP